MKGKNEYMNEVKQRRKKMTAVFYKNNKLRFAATVFILAYGSILVVGISSLLQQATDVALGGEVKELIRIILMTIGIIVLLTINWLCERIVRNRFMEKAQKQYKEYVFDKIINKNISSFAKETTGRYISSLTNDMISIEENFLQGNFLLILQILSFVLALGLMIWYNWIMTVIAMGLSVLSLLASLIFGDRLMKAERKVSIQNELYVSMLKDLLSGFTVIKSFKAEERIKEIFQSQNGKLEEMKCGRRKTDALINLVASSAGLVVQIGIILIGVFFVMTDFITMGVLVAFVQLMGIMLTPVQTIPKLLANRKAAIGLIDKIAEVVEYHADNHGMVEITDIGTGVECRNLHFAYEPGHEILKGIHITFEKGKSYAIVGASGCGKSTLLNLLLGSYSSYDGSMKIGGTELRDINLNSLYDMISIIQQNVFIFDNSVIDNITMFSEFEDDKIEKVIRLSGLTKLVDEKGKDYKCGENGSGLSGGEKQRISIARCLLRETPILIMDEATASLDRETSYMVEDAILNIDGLTRIIVTHKYEDKIMEKYDEIIVLSGGKVVERGTFQELLEKKEIFYSLYNVSNVE